MIDTIRFTLDKLLKRANELIERDTKARIRMSANYWRGYRDAMNDALLVTNGEKPEQINLELIHD